MERRIGRREARVERAFLIGAREAPDLAYDVCSDRDRVGAERRQGRMGFMPGDQRPEGRDALVGVGDRHHRRLADNDCSRTRLILAEPGDDVAGAQAGGLLVIAQHDMNRPLQAGVPERGGHRQHAGVEALHVAGAAAKEPPGLLAQCERRARPRLPLHRHNVGMAGEHDAAIDPGADRGQDRGLVAGSVRRAPRLEPMRAQIGLDEVDDRQVGGIADALDGDEPLEQRLGLGETA